MKMAREIEILGRGVMVRNGKLLVCHSKGADIVYLPGGHVEVGEGAEEAVCREIMEEMGKKARVKRFLGCAEHAFIQKGEPHVELNLLFEIEVAGLSVARLPESFEQHIEFLWLPMDQLKRSNLEPAPLRRLLPLWLKARGSAPWRSLIAGKSKSAS